jgi:hypothetical protein
MKLSKYLSLNESRTEKISEKKAKEIIEKNCKKAINSTPIYRGKRVDEEEKSDALEKRKFLFIDPKMYYRKPGYYDFHNTMIWTLPSWFIYPNRRNAIICTTKKYEAETYGNIVYRVLLYDNAKLGVCSDSDFFFSFRNVENISIFSKNVSRLVNCVVNDMYEVDKTIKTGEDFVRYVDKFDKINNTEPRDFFLRCLDRFRETGDFEYSKNTLYNALKKKEPLLEALDKLLDPEKNGFKLRKIGDELPTGIIEVWSDSKALLLLETN